MTSEQRAGSFSTVQNYDNDDEAWATDDIGQLQVEVSACHHNIIHFEGPVLHVSDILLIFPFLWQQLLSIFCKI